MGKMAMTRRKTLTTSGLLAATSFLLSPAAGEAQPATVTTKTLVAYYSRTGNTRLVARQLQRDLNADLFEIVPAIEYPEDYQATVRQAKEETDRDFRPRLRELGDLRSYDTILLGFPVWGETAPPVIRSFLTAHDIGEKTLAPCITHGGYGPGRSIGVLARHAPRARLTDAFVMKADQERESLAQVTQWLARSHLKQSPGG